MDEICNLIKGALTDKSLSTPQLQKLRGRLAFASQQTSGRWPSLLLSTLSLKGRDGVDSCLSGDPFPVLQWFVEHLPDVPPRVVRLVPGDNPWIIFSDGAVEDAHSSLGFILVGSVKKLMWWSRSLVPDSWLQSWHRRGVARPICEVEKLAVLCAYNTWGPLTRGSRCLVKQLVSRWQTIRTPDGKDLWLKMDTGQTQYTSPLSQRLSQTHPI